MKDMCTLILYNFNISTNIIHFQNYLFIKKSLYFLLENMKNEYLKYIIPFIRKIENSYISYKNKKIKFSYRNKIIVIQNYMRKYLFFHELQKKERKKNLLTSFIIFYSYLLKHKNMEETKETLEYYKETFMSKEKKLIQHAACVYIQSWFRKIIQQRKYKAMKLEILKTHAREKISTAIKTYITQIKMIKNLNEVLIPNRCATLIQSCFRRYRCMVQYEKKMYLKICFLSIKRKYMAYTNVITKMNYHYLIKNIYRKNFIKNHLKIPEAVVKIQSKYKAYVVRKQYNMLRDAIYFTQSYIHTCIERIKYEQLKKKCNYYTSMVEKFL